MTMMASPAACSMPAVIAIGKRRVEGTEHVSDNVRREELVVDGDANRVAGTDTSLGDR